MSGGVEHLYTIVATVGYNYESVRVDGHSARVLELAVVKALLYISCWCCSTERGAYRSECEHEMTIVIEHLYTMIASVGDDQLVLTIDGDEMWVLELSVAIA